MNGVDYLHQKHVLTKIWQQGTREPVQTVSSRLYLYCTASLPVGYSIIILILILTIFCYIFEVSKTGSLHKTGKIKYHPDQTRPQQKYRPNRFSKTTTV